jgi:hypothetical protein
MRKAVCFTAGAAAILLAGSAPAQRHAGAMTSENSGAALHRGGHGGRLTGGGMGCGRLAAAACSGVQRGRGRGARGFGWPGFGYGELIEDPDARDDGFFAQTGDSWTANGYAVYDYDRSYPYDWYRGSPPAPARARLRPPPMMRCDVTWVPGGRGAPSPVRVCRGR